MRQSKTRISRRSILTGATAAGLSALGTPSFAQGAPAVVGKTKIVVTGFYRTPAFHVAQRRGLFAKEGLDVEFLLVRLAPDHNEGLAHGRWPLTMSSADTMLARTTQDGVDFVLFLEAEEGLDVQLSRSRNTNPCRNYAASCSRPIRSTPTTTSCATRSCATPACPRANTATR